MHPVYPGEEEWYHGNQAFSSLRDEEAYILYNKNFSFYYTKSLRQALKVEIKHKKLFRKQEEWKDVKDPL